MLVSTHAACMATSVAKRLLFENIQSYCPHMVDPWSQRLFAVFLPPNLLPVCLFVSCIENAAGFHLGSKESMGWVPKSPFSHLEGHILQPPLEVGNLLLSARNPPACLSRSISVIVGKCSLEISPLLHFMFMFYSGSQVFQFFPLEYSLQQRPCCCLKALASLSSPKRGPKRLLRHCGRNRRKERVQPLQEGRLLGEGGIRGMKGTPLKREE